MSASAKEADAVQASDKKTFLLSSNVSFIHDPATFMRKTSRNSTLYWPRNLGFFV